MKKKYGFMMLMIGLIMGLIFCFSSGVRGVAKADDVKCKIYIDGGSYTLSDGTIRGETENPGYGVYATGESSTFIMSGGEITNNVYGVQCMEGAAFTMDNGTISANSSVGVGVANGSSFIMNDGGISNSPLGVFLISSNFTMKNGTISNIDPSKGVYVYSAGVFAGNSTITMDGGTICNCNNPDADYGGGVVLYMGVTFTMNSGTISGNSGRSCGGVYVGFSSSFTMNGGTIKGNNATSGGGGVYVYDGTFTMNGGEISGNTATYGGAIVVCSGCSFKYAGGTIDGEIALISSSYSSATFVIGKEPETPFDINFIGDPPDGKVAKLEGIDTIDLSKIKLVNYPDAQLSIREIDGEKWVVMGQNYTVTIGGGYYTIVKVPYKNYSDIPADVRKQAVETIEFQVPEGTTVIIADELCVDNFQIGDEYVHTVSGTKKLGFGFYFYKWYLYDDKDRRITQFPYTIKSNVKIEQSVSNESRADIAQPEFLPADHPEREEKSNEYYVENKKTTIKSERKSRV